MAYRGAEGPECQNLPSPTLIPLDGFPIRKIIAPRKQAGFVALLERITNEDTGGDSGFQSAVVRDGRNHAHSVKTRLAETAHGIAPRLIGAGGVAVFCGSGGKRYKPSAIARPTSAIAPTNTPTPSQPCEA